MIVLFPVAGGNRSWQRRAIHSRDNVVGREFCQGKPVYPVVLVKAHKGSEVLFDACVYTFRLPIGFRVKC